MLHSARVISHFKVMVPFNLTNYLKHSIDFNMFYSYLNFTDEQVGRSSSESSVSEARTAFLQQDKRGDCTERQSPSKDAVSRRRSMFANLSSAREVPKSVPAVDIRVPLRDRVASFENIDDSSFKNPVRFKSVEAIEPRPNKATEETLVLAADVWSKESVLNRSDLIETSIDSSGSEEAVVVEAEVSNQVATAMADGDEQPGEVIDDEIREESRVEFPERELEELCDDGPAQVADDSGTVEPAELVVPVALVGESQSEVVVEEHMVPVEIADAGCLEDVGSALDEALGLLDDSGNTKTDDTAVSICLFTDSIFFGA